MESGHTKVLAAIQKSSDSLGTRFDGLKTSFEKLESNSESRFSVLDASTLRILRRLDENTSGLGRGLEGLVIAWLEHVLQQKGLGEIEIERGHNFKDDPELTNVEIVGYHRLAFDSGSYNLS